MRLTALWVCGTLLAFSSLSWITADSDEGLLLGDKGFGPCIATLTPDGPCRQDESSCPYLFSLPPLTVHLPQQLRELEKIMEDLQKLKDSVDQLRELCADCTVSQTGRECGRQREHEKLSEGKDGCEDKRNWMNERLQENDRDFRQEFGTDRVKVDKTEGDGDLENRLFLEEKERGKWEPERESDRGVIKGNEKEVTRTEVAEKGGKTQTEGAKGKDKLGQIKVPTAGGNERKVAIMREKVADKNTRERETDKKKDNAGTENQKQDDKENGKERKVQPHVWQGETKKTKKTQTEASDKIKMSEDHGGHTNKEPEQHEEERKKEMEKRIKVEQNIERPKQTENIRRTEKEKTIKEGEVEEEGRKTVKEIKTEKEKTENVQRNSDGELSSNKAIERTDFVSISPTPWSIINIASRPDSNKATIFTSSIPSLSLPSSTLDLITDASHEAITAYGPTQSPGLRAAAFSEPPHPDAESDTTTATISTLGGPGQQKTSATTKLNSASKVRPGAGFQGHISSTTTTTTLQQNLYMTAFPGGTDQSRWTAKKNISSNTKTGVKPLPGQGPSGETHKAGIKPEDQKLKNPKNVRKSDQAPFPDKKTKHDQKQKPSLYKPKPANNPDRVNVSKPNQRTPPDLLPTDQNLKRNPTPTHNQDRTPDQNKSPLQKPKPPQKPVTPVRTPTTHRRLETVNATSSDKHPLINQKQKPSLYKPATDQSKPANDPRRVQISKPDQRTRPDLLPTDQNLKNTPTSKQDQDRTPVRNKLPIQKSKSDQMNVGPVQRRTSLKRPETVNATNSDKDPLINQKQKPSHYKPTTDQSKPANNPDRVNTSKPNQRTPLGIVPTDQNLKNNQTSKQDQDHTPDQNKSPLQTSKSPQKPVTPVRTPTTHRRPETVNATHSDKHPLIDQKQKPSLYNPTTDRNPERDQTSKHDQRTPSDLLPTDQNLKNNPTLKRNQDHTPDQSKSPLQTPKSHQKPVTPIQRPTSHQRPETVNATNSDKGPLINRKQKPSHYKPTTDQSKPANNPDRVNTSKPNQRTLPDLLPTDQNLKNNPTSKQDQDNTPATHRRPETVNATHFDKHPLIDQKQKPSFYNPTTDQNPDQEQTSKHDQRTPSDLLPTDQNLKNNPTLRQDQDHTPDQSKSPLQTPKSHQKPVTPVRTPTSHRRPETVNATHSDKHPLIDQKQKPSLYNPTTDQNPEQDQTSKHDQRTPSDLLPTDQNLKNNPIPKGNEDRRPDQNKSPYQKPKTHQTPVVPVQRPTSHQRPETVNTAHSDKHPIIDPKQKASLYNPTTDQSKPGNDPEQDQVSITDQITPPDLLTTDPNLKNNPTLRQDQDHTPDQSKSPLQTPKSHQKPVTPVWTPTTHRRPETVMVTESDKKPLINQKQKPSLYKPTTNQSKPVNKPERDHISNPDQRTPPDILPTDQKLKNNPIPDQNQDHTPDQLNKLPTEKPNSKSGVPVQRPTSRQNVNATYPDKHPVIERAYEPNGTPAINQNSKPEEKLIHPVKTDQAGEKENPRIKPHSEEKTQPDQNVELNQYPKSVQEPESKRSETESFTPKPNERPLIESRERSDVNPSIEPKSNQDSTPKPDRDNTPPNQKPKPSQKISKVNQKPKPGQVPKPNQKLPRPVTEIKTKPNVNRKTDQVPQTSQRLNTTRPGQIPNLNAKSVPGAGPDAKSDKTPKPKPPPRYRPPAKPAVKPGVTPIQRPRPAVQPKPNVKTKIHLIPTQISWTTSDAVQNSQTDMPPTAGPAKQITEVTHSPGDTEFSPSMRKTITLAPKTSNSLETGASPHLHTLPEDFTTSPNSRSTSDLRPQTASQLPSIPMTTRPNKIIRRILPSVIPNTRPGPMKPNLTPKSDSSLQDEILHSEDSTAPAGQVPSPSSQTTSTLSPDFRSTTPATSSPEPLAAESSTPSARELRVKINQVAAFLNNSRNPNGRPPQRHPKEQPEDTEGSSRPDGTDSKLPTLTPSKVLYRDCSDHLLRGEARSGVYLVTPDPRDRSFPVFCDMEQGGGGWTVLQRRQDGSVSFNRTWAEYQSGFGELDGGEFWLGNYLIHLLTRDRDMVLRVELEDFDGVAEFARYEQFRVASERLRYRLTVGGYSGTAGDALRFNKNYDHNHRAFTTPDRDHDRYPSGNCGVYYSSGWWFDACMAANLNGRYYKGRYKGVRDGIFWGTWHNISSEYYPTNDRQSFKSVRMMIRPKGFAP